MQVSEILDSELLGEGLIPTLQHAHDMLLVENPRAVPYQATIYGQVHEQDFHYVFLLLISFFLADSDFSFGLPLLLLCCSLFIPALNLVLLDIEQDPISLNKIQFSF